MGILDVIGPTGNGLEFDEKASFRQTNGTIDRDGRSLSTGRERSRSGLRAQGGLGRLAIRNIILDGEDSDFTRVQFLIVLNEGDSLHFTGSVVNLHALAQATDRDPHGRESEVRRIGNLHLLFK